MGKPLIGDEIEVWDMGKIVKGTLYSVRRTVFGKVKYIVAVVVPNGFDPYGIGREKYKYLTFNEDSILTPNKSTKDKAGR